MHELFGDLLPEAMYRRVSKATFNEAFWRSHSRVLVEQWRGDGIPTELVDPEALRREWTTPVPDAHTYTLLQSVWLAGAASAASS